MSGRTSGRWLPWLNQWGWPFVWILLIPVVTASWSGTLIDHVLDKDICTLAKQGWHAESNLSGTGPDIWRCPWEDAWPTLLPGLLNLVAFAWVLSGRREVRWAGLVAGTLGAVRLAAPLLIYRLSGADVEVYVGTGDPSGGWVWNTTGGSDISRAVSMFLWVLSAGSAILFLVGANIAGSWERKHATMAMQARAQDEQAQLLARLRDEGLITEEEYQSKRERQARAQGKCKNCGKSLTVDDKLRNRGTGLCWGCLSGGVNSRTGRQD